MNPISKNTSHTLGAEHGMSRRLFMNSLAVSLAGTGGLVGNAGSAHLFDQAPLQKELKAKGRSVILVWLAGGASQFETWDPKPGRATGGPFGTLPPPFQACIFQSSCQRWPGACIKHASYDPSTPRTVGMTPHRS